jgi:hypothetical protein
VCGAASGSRRGPELTYPFHDGDILVAACRRICLHRKKINVSTVLATQSSGIRKSRTAFGSPASFTLYFARPTMERGPLEMSGEVKAPGASTRGCPRMRQVY